MTERDDMQADAADWVVRLSRADAGEADWMDFQAWLDAAPDNRAAFDAAQDLWLELEREAAPLAAALAPSPRRAQAYRRPARRRPAPRRWIAAIAATLAVAVIGGGVAQEMLRPASVYRTGPAERMKVALPDGSTLTLNSGSQAEVRYGRFSRKVALTGAEAAFDVVPDRARPFTVAVNHAQVRVVGTEFNIRSDANALAVTVRRGVVQVAGGDGAATAPVKVSAGHQLTRSGQGDRLVAIPAVDDAFSWRTGQLVYRARPLTEVVSDLNRYFSSDIMVDGDAAALTFSGVIHLDTKDDVVARLCELLPLAASTRNGSIILQAHQKTR